jgi:hypothetical protein
LEKLGQAPASSDIAALSQASLFRVRTTPQPGAEAALRRMIEGTQRGRPDYDRLAPGFARIVRHQIATIQPLLATLGPIQSVTYRGPNMDGDRFEVTFAKGAQLWSLSLTPDGKVAGALFGPAPPPSPPPAASAPG